jgi:hypothetical protein
MWIRQGITMTLGDAINAVESAATDLSNADLAQTAAQAKFEAALANKQASDQADADAVVKFNDSLDVLIEVATAAKRGTTS